MRSSEGHGEISALGGAVEDLAAAITRRRLGPRHRVEIGVIAATLATLARLALEPLLGEHLPFSFFFPAVLIAAVFGGGLAATVSLVLSLLAGWRLFLPPALSFAVEPGMVAQIPLFAVLGSSTAALGLFLRASLIRLETHRRRHEEVVAVLSQRLERDFATVAALARDALRGSPVEQGGGEVLKDRLDLIRDIHAQLARVGWQPLPTQKVLSRVLRRLPREEADRIVLLGPSLLADPDQAVVIALALADRLETARRQGRLRTGCVELSWRRDEELIELLWRQVETEAASARNQIASPIAG